ncbi:FHA domain-containing protein [uncultured Tateyamaria sp.]|uniref:FHA domain-containing protein n=1 Tax=uncultured Tateyamaria sp. TaxID=455651 RepID=UPI0026315BF9|nr:FHA domain-containing protein [uncultured Tateyamaria sp.]
MKIFSGLFGRKAKASVADEVEYDLSVMREGPNRVDMLKVDEVDSVPEPAPLEEQSESEAVADVESEVETPQEAAPAVVNIWELDDDEEDAAIAPAAPVAAAPDRTTSRERRNRTRLIGFDTSRGDVVDLFEDTPQAAASTGTVQFPVGWLLVVQGPGRGHAIPLVAGMSQIGRGEDQAVRLDFGDNTISRTNHAAIVYDSETRKFILGHGGKANIVRLNNQPVISNEDLSDGDQIKIGETLIQLKALCGESFDWSDDDGNKEREDVAIA